MGGAVLGFNGVRQRHGFRSFSLVCSDTVIPKYEISESLVRSTVAPMRHASSDNRRRRAQSPTFIQAVNATQCLLSVPQSRFSASAPFFLFIGPGGRVERTCAPFTHAPTFWSWNKIILTSTKSELCWRLGGAWLRKLEFVVAAATFAPRSSG